MSRENEIFGGKTAAFICNSLWSKDLSRTHLDLAESFVLGDTALFGVLQSCVLTAKTASQDFLLTLYLDAIRVVSTSIHISQLDQYCCQLFFLAIDMAHAGFGGGAGYGGAGYGTKVLIFFPFC